MSPHVLQYKCYRVYTNMEWNTDDTDWTDKKDFERRDAPLAALILNTNRYLRWILGLFSENAKTTPWKSVLSVSSVFYFSSKKMCTHGRYKSETQVKPHSSNTAWDIHKNILLKTPCTQLTYTSLIKLLWEMKGYLYLCISDNFTNQHFA